MNRDNETLTLEAVIKKHFDLDGFALVSVVLEFQGALISVAWHPFTGKSAAAKSLDVMEDALRRIMAGRHGITPSVFKSLTDYRREDQITRSALMMLILEPEKFLPAIDAARQSLEVEDEFSRRSLASINVRAVQVVRAAVKIWDKYNEKPAPRKSLNDASPFADYLRDVFSTQGLSAKVKAAHRTWANTHGAAKVNSK